MHKTHTKLNIQQNHKLHQMQNTLSKYTNTKHTKLKNQTIIIPNIHKSKKNKHTTKYQ